MSDAYVDTLTQMITLLQEYRPGLVTLENVTRLCKTLKLESFIDNIDNDTLRLSTASKIIVIDMDFHKSDKQVKDVKLVLASNFDGFNYFNDGDNGNILFNSLSCFSDLQTFYYNVKFLSILDAHSNIEIEPGVTTKRDRFDLFKYFTELPDQLRTYFQDLGVDARVKTNVDNRFGIYLTRNDEPFAKISLEECQDREYRFYEYIYKNGEWINESPESVTSGIKLTLQISDQSLYFPLELASHDLLMGSDSQRPFSVVNHQRSIPLHNDLTSTLVPATKFNISNDNIELLVELLRWLYWWQQVLSPVLQTLKCPAPILAGEPKRRSSSNSTIMSAQRRSSTTRRRRSSQKGRRPSVNDSSMMKDGGLQEFTLSDIMNQPVLEDDETSEPVEVTLNEEYVELSTGERCDIRMNLSQWQEFMLKFKSSIS